MSRTLNLEMDPFGLQAFTELAERHGGSASSVARMAAHYYLADSSGERPAWRVPAFARGAEPKRRRTDVRVELDDATWSALFQEARRQGVGICALATHAVLYFISDVDTGRVAERMDDSLAERRDP
jgi:hypothetical protein